MKNLYAIADELKNGEEDQVEYIKSQKDFIKHCYEMFDAYTTVIAALEMVGVTKLDIKDHKLPEHLRLQDSNRADA